MIFWLAQTLTLIAGLIGIALIRTLVVRCFPQVRAEYFDVALVLFLVVGIALAIREYHARTRESEEFSRQVETIKNYSDVAQLTFNDSAFVGGDVKFNNDLTYLMDGTWKEMKPNRYERVCTEAAQVKRREAMKRFPRFPFSHYWFALCLRDQHNPEWRDHAFSALDIFNRTTTIAGHQASHDEAKATLEQFLKDRPSPGSN
jgi:hypothetical protein